MLNFWLSAQNNLIIKAWLSLAMTIGVFSWSVTSKAAETDYSPKKTAVMELSNAEMIKLVQQVHQQVNQYRRSLNLAPLRLDTQISNQAKIHSRNMAQGTVAFSHQGFEDRVKALKDNISYRSAAENLAYNQGYSNPVSRAISGWIESEGHRQNMIGNYNLTGIGVAKNQRGEYYFTQIFIKN